VLTSTLELRSQAAGDATLLKCTCDVGLLRLREEPTEIDRLYDLDCALGMVKICTVPDDHKRLDEISVAGEIEFGPEYTQLSEVASLLTRTAVAASWIRKVMVSGDDEDWPPRIRHSRTGLDELANEVRHLIRSERLPWTQTDHAVDVQLWRNDRSHTVRLDCRNGMFVFESTVSGPSQVTKSKTYRRDLAYRVWRINALKELITFSFDYQDRLIGMIETPETTMDTSELKLYIETVAKECDRLRYVLTGL
jgi:hypothetical protein